jgi:hypothetical protein
MNSSYKKRLTGRVSQLMAVLGLLLASLLLAPATGQVQEAQAQVATVPIFRIVEVVANQSVTIETRNFPPNQNFTVRMGPMGAQAIGGAVVGSTDSGAGGTFRATFNIPASLHGHDQIAMRMDSPQGFFSFNWFYNRTWSEGDPVGIGAVQPAQPAQPAQPVAPLPPDQAPIFRVVDVVANQSVTIETRNFPPNQVFTVRMGPFGTQGIGGAVVGTTDSGAGGTFRATYVIPANLHTSQLIAMRMDSPQGWFSFNWFYNRTWTAGDPVGIGAVQPGEPAAPVQPQPVAPLPPGQAPMITFVEVVANQSVTIETRNFPPNQTFTARMGPFGTQAVGGAVVGTTHSGEGGVFRATYEIPAHLHNSQRIAIRLDSPEGWFSYNWFFNTTWRQ